LSFEVVMSCSGPGENFTGAPASAGRPAGQSGIGTPAVSARGMEKASMAINARIRIGSNLRIRSWPKNQVRDVRNDCFVIELRRRTELFPIGIGEERLPFCVELGEIRKAHHVGKLRQTLADQCIAIKHGPESRLFEDLELAAVEHFDLAAVGGYARAFIRAHLEHTRAALRANRCDSELRVA